MSCKEYPLCEYAKYETNPNNMIFLKCSKNNGLCVYSRYCSTLLKIIHTSSYTSCPIKNKK